MLRITRAEQRYQLSFMCIDMINKTTSWFFPSRVYFKKRKKTSAQDFLKLFCALNLLGCGFRQRTMTYEAYPVSLTHTEFTHCYVRSSQSSTFEYQNVIRTRNSSLCFDLGFHRSIIIRTFNVDRTSGSIEVTPSLAFRSAT